MQKKAIINKLYYHQHIVTYIEGLFHVHVKESNLLWYLNTTGCTGTPGKNAPPLKVINALPFVHVPSGKIAV